MRYVGIDIARHTHLVAIVDEALTVIVKPTAIPDDATGYDRLNALIGSPADVLVVMEATGHYWQNLFACLCARHIPCAIVNPLRIRRFSQEDLRRAKTDRTDALTIARFGALRRPDPAPPPDPVLDNLRELVRLRERLGQDYADRTRQLHRLLVLVFPEFTQVIREIDGLRATLLLQRYPSARAFRRADIDEMAALRVSSRAPVGRRLAADLVRAAASSVSHHDSAAYETSVRAICADLDSLRRSKAAIDVDVDKCVSVHPLAAVLSSIKGLGKLTVGRLLARLGDPSHFRSPAALAAYVGVVPATNESGLSRPGRAPISSIGNAELRAMLWMPTLVAIQHNTWLRAYYLRMVARGKPKKVVVVAAMRKLLLAIYSVSKNRRPFVPRVEVTQAPPASLAGPGDGRGPQAPEPPLT